MWQQSLRLRWSSVGRLEVGGREERKDLRRGREKEVTPREDLEREGEEERDCSVERTEANTRSAEEDAQIW